MTITLRPYKYEIILTAQKVDEDGRTVGELRGVVTADTESGEIAFFSKAQIDEWFAKKLEQDMAEAAAKLPENQPAAAPPNRAQRRSAAKKKPAPKARAGARSPGAGAPPD